VTAVTAITWVFALLLAAAGAQKLADPAAAGAALQMAKLPSDARVVRLLGSYEVMLAGAVLLVGGALPALALAVTYAAFAGFAARQSRRGEGCGCFGEPETPTTAVHVTLNVVAAVTAAAAAWSPTGALPAALGSESVSLVTVLVLLVTATGLLRLMLTALPELTAARALLTADGDQ
jgi:hypothetical protein